MVALLGSGGLQTMELTPEVRAAAASKPKQT
jgi:hypothetical protein